MADITYTKPTWVNGSTVPISAANLQAISDAVDAVAHKANRGSAILDADTVSGYGIGTEAPATIDSATLDATHEGGLYRCSTPAGLAADAYTALVMPITNAACVQIVVQDSTLRTWIRRAVNSSTWSAWYEIFNANTDGNGGQPPAPKPNNTNITDTPGWDDTADLVSGGTLTMAGGSGTWLWEITSPYGALVGTLGQGILAAGASAAGTASVNLRYRRYKLS